MATTAIVSPVNEASQDAIRAYYHTLFSAWGRQHWWPAQSRFEVIVGAYLTQNTAWTNVEKALGNLRRARLLTVSGIRRTSQPELEQLIRSAGYFRQKAQRLETFVHFLDERYGGSLTRMLARPTAELRDELLALNGVGPRPPTRFCCMPAIIQSLWWTLTLGAFWNGMGLSTARLAPRPNLRQAMRRFDNCLSRHWAEFLLRRALHRRDSEAAEKIRNRIIFPELKNFSSALPASRR